MKIRDILGSKKSKYKTDDKGFGIKIEDSGTHIHVNAFLGQEQIGELSAYRKEDTIKITSSGLSDGYRRKGYGTLIYKAIFDIAENENKVALSDRNVTKSAAMSYRAVAKKFGYSVILVFNFDNPEVSMDEPGAGSGLAMLDPKMSHESPCVFLPKKLKHLSYGQAVAYQMSKVRRDDYSKHLDKRYADHEIRINC